MAVLSSLVVQLALESATFQSGLRSARTSLASFSREAGGVARVGRDFQHVARGADALALSLGTVNPALGRLAQGAVQATLAARGLAGGIGLIASPAGALVVIATALGLALGRWAGIVTANLPVIDQLTSKLASLQAMGQKAVIAPQALGITAKDIQDRAQAAAQLAQRLAELRAELAAIETVAPIDVALIDAESAKNAVAVVELTHQKIVATIQGELNARLVAAAQVGRKQEEVEAIRVVAVADANAQIAVADATLAQQRQALLQQFITEVQQLFASLGPAFADVTQRLSLQASLQQAQQQIQALQGVFAAGFGATKVRADEVSAAVFAITERLLSLGATSQQVMAILPAEFQRFAASVPLVDAALESFNQELQTSGLAVADYTQKLAALPAPAASAATAIQAVAAAASGAAAAAKAAGDSTQVLGLGLDGVRFQSHLTIADLIQLNQTLLQTAQSMTGFRFINVTAIERAIRELQDLQVQTSGLPQPVITTAPRFQTGGIVPGPRGQAVPILAHAGERVLPAGSTGRGDTFVVNLNGTTVLSQRRAVSQFARLVAGHLADQRRRHG